MRTIGLSAMVAALAMLVVSTAYAGDPSLSAAANANFLTANAKKPGVVTTASGLQYQIIHNGFGKRPGAFNKVQVYYKGELINGTVFDSTEPGLPATFTVNQLIPGWAEALELMRQGDEWRLVIPANLAYGSRGAGSTIPPNQTLVFDLRLIKVLPPEKTPEQDSDTDQ